MRERLLWQQNVRIFCSYLKSVFKHIVVTANKQFVYSKNKYFAQQQLDEKRTFHPKLIIKLLCEILTAAIAKIPCGRTSTSDMHKILLPEMF
jgi:hypothetical protein